MALTINNNSAAFGVWSNFSANSTNLQKAMNHLSTGVKQVFDDPSGIGISERMRSQARNVAMSRSNVDNGLSLLQTADSWMQKMNDMLGRMSELSIENGDGTKSTTDKSNIQTEFKQLQNEMVRITSHDTSAAKFNGLFLFRGGNGIASVSDKVGQSGNISLQIGPDNGQSVNLSLKNLQVDSTEIMGSVHSFTYSTNNVSLKSSTHTAVTWGSITNDTKFSVGSADAVGKLSKAIDFIASARATNGAQRTVSNTPAAACSPTRTTSVRPNRRSATSTWLRNRPRCRNTRSSTRSRTRCCRRPTSCPKLPCSSSADGPEV